MLSLCIVVATAAADPASDTAPVRRESISDLPLSATIHVGKTADWVAIAPDAVWVGSTSPNAVHRIDPKTNLRVATVALPGEPCAGLASGFGSLWVPLCGQKPALARVDLRSHQIAQLLSYATAAECGITVSEDSVWLVLEPAGSLIRIDPIRGKVRQTIQLPAGACNPAYSDGIVWVTNAEGASLIAVDAASASLLSTTLIGPHPRFLASSPGDIWTLNQGDGSLTRIDAHTRQVTKTIALGTPGHGGDIAYGGGMIWTTLAGVPLSATDPATNTVYRQWSGPGGDSLRVGHGAIWLTDYHAGTISRIRLEDALDR
jgi:virginiamycin B lyase